MTKPRYRLSTALHELIEEFYAKALAGTTLRNMGPSKTVACARKYLKTIDLAEIGKAGKTGFSALLDDHTKKLASRLPGLPGEKWGVARKSLNLFFRDAVYNHYLRKHYGLAPVEAALEIPLDSNVSDRLHVEPEGKNLPSWGTVKRLKSEDSAKFQAAAARDRERGLFVVIEPQHG
jgi:hypothetical protein